MVPMSNVDDTFYTMIQGKHFALEMSSSEQLKSEGREGEHLHKTTTRQTLSN
jgi:hypothetical protein